MLSLNTSRPNSTRPFISFTCLKNWWFIVINCSSVFFLLNSVIAVIWRFDSSTPQFIMGVLMSKENSVLLENCEDASQSSPPSAVVRTHPHRFLPSELDPRSPSAGIDRTPIQIAVSSNLVDPRSPSCGIERTPIHVLPKPAVIPVLDPRSPTAGINRTPIVCYTTLQPCNRI